MAKAIYSGLCLVLFAILQFAEEFLVSTVVNVQPFLIFIINALSVSGMLYLGRVTLRVRITGGLL